MKLRTQISLLLFLFGLIPLLVAFVINVPMIFDRINALYHKAHLENLRAGFSDLDQHIARRHEMARLLAKMPVPGLLHETDDADNNAALAAARSSYVDWLNQVMFDQLDITQIIFVDESGQSVFWLDRDIKTGQLEPRDEIKTGLNEGLLKAGREMPPGSVLTGPIVVDREAVKQSPTRHMQLSIISPVMVPVISIQGEAADKGRGSVVVYLDMGGLATAYRGNYWVHNNGHYLALAEGDDFASTAFGDFQGLESIFEKGELGLWKFKGQQVLWVPLFDTESSGPLWVGRSVDPSPIVRLQRAIEGRVATVALGLLIVVFLVARLIAVRTERLGRELTDGISKVLEKNEPVSFSWQRPEELQSLGGNLTRLAETHADHSRALQEYARELEDTNRYKSEFLANVSHELRTPLNSILLLSKMLAESCTARKIEDEGRQAQVIHAAGSDLKALIDNILDLSRVEARQLILVTETVNLRDSLHAVVELLQPQFDEKQLRLDLEIDESVPESIVTDGEKLRQILVNFLSNAVKFTEQGHVSVRLASGVDQDGNNWPVALSVTDTGIGISSNKREVVFEAFKQADGSTSRRFGGTGLGLTISRELAHLMGGRIQVESEIGQGSTFTLFLPQLTSDISEEHPAVSSLAGSDVREAESPALPVADYHNARVLLVDDDVRNLLALTPLLERWQLEVMAAGDGAEALETLDTGGEFNVVLMDIMMPGMDGFEVIEKLREQPRFGDLPVIALTAKAADADRQRCLDAGASDCVIKPIDPQQLKDMLDRFLGTSTDGDVQT